MKVATTSIDITPIDKFFPCYLSGHAIRSEMATGILDSIYTTLLLLEINNSRVLFITIELIALDADYTNLIRQQISSKYNIQKDLIFVCFSHTHSAPEYSEYGLFGNTSAISGYMDFITNKIYKAIDDIISNLITVSAFSFQMEINDIFGNRNHKHKVIDKTFNLVEFKSDNKTIAAFCNFSSHSTILGPKNLKISGDLAGRIARVVDRKIGVYPLITIGAAGDVSSRFYRQGDDESELIRMEKLFEFQFLQKYNLELITCQDIVYDFYNYRQTFWLKKEDNIEKMRIIEERIKKSQNYDEIKVYNSALAILKKSLNLKSFTLDLKCAYISLGDWKMFIIPAELFSQFGIEIKKHMQARVKMIVGYCNYLVGYLGNCEDYGKSFETIASNIPINTTERIVDLIIDFIQRKEKQNENIIS